MKSACIKPVFGAAFIWGAALLGFAASPQISLAETAAPAAPATDTAPKVADPASPPPVPAAPASPPPASSTPSSQPAPASPVVPPATPAPAPASPTPPPTASEPENKAAPGVPDDATAQMLQIPARPVAFLRGKSDWESGFKSIQKSLDTIKSEVAKAGLKQGGKPIAVFVETDDNGFGYEAMVPLAEKPEGKDQLGSDVKVGSSPAGKAIKFQHRGAYDDIDSTYDLITAYLDEKGLEAQNLFIEEYLTDTKNADDQALEVDIYVFIK